MDACHPSLPPTAAGAVTVAALIIAVIVSQVLGPTTTSGAQPAALMATFYQPPVDAPVIDAFRPPGTPYGPGNRGLEYDTADDTVVSSSAGGTVTFAGWIGDKAFITLRHDDAVSTTYSNLTRLDVAEGDTVLARTPIGLAGSGFHFGAKRASHYLDPAVLLAASASRDRPSRAVLIAPDAG